EWQQKNYSVNRPRRPFKIGILRKVKQLTRTVPVLINHSVDFYF
ncbi:unnamed protein product, partial [marine sediment metagenome]